MFFPHRGGNRPTIRQRGFDCSIMRPNANGSVPTDTPNDQHVSEAGRERISTTVTALNDTKILVSRFDTRFPVKQRIATEVLRPGILEDLARVLHRALIEFIAAATRPIGLEIH